MMQKLFLDIGKEEIQNQYKKDEKKTSLYKTTHFIVEKEQKKEIKKECGDYYVLEFQYETLMTRQMILEKELERILKLFLKKYPKTKKVLIVGLGNKNVDGDALGVLTTDALIATNQYQDFLTLPKIALLNPSVTEKTGISSFKLIEMVVHDLKPDLIILIDSLATKNKEYLNQAIEINDTGFIPGSAIHSCKEINQKTFHIPILSIGSPLCLEMENQFFTSVFIHEVLKSLSTILSTSLNHLFLK